MVRDSRALLRARPGDDMLASVLVVLWLTTSLWYFTIVRFAF
jgi:hypothetical protein